MFVEKQGIIIQVLDAHKTLRFFEEYHEVPIEHHWRGSPLRGRRTLAETGHGTYAPGQSRVPSLVTLTSKGQPCPTSSAIALVTVAYTCIIIEKMSR